MRTLDERGAETLEFALVSPALFLLLLGVVYGLVAVASQVTLGHAASVGVRYASVLESGSYPTEADVARKVESSTPFFAPGACTSTVTGDSLPYAPITLDVACRMPGFPVLTARATGRRE